MNILFAANDGKQEIDLSDSVQGLRKLGALLCEVNSTLEILSKKEKSEVYPENLDKLVLKKTNRFDQTNLLDISVSQNSLVFEGTQIALENLGQSLLNYFDENCPKDVHLHLDYFEGNQIIGPTNCDLVVRCNGPE